MGKSGRKASKTICNKVDTKLERWRRAVHKPVTQCRRVDNIAAILLVEIARYMEMIRPAVVATPTQAVLNTARGGKEASYPGGRSSAVVVKIVVCASLG